MLHEVQHLPQRSWMCAGCAEPVEGGFTQCWNCGLPEPMAY
jgi:hypothetical protein